MEVLQHKRGRSFANGSRLTTRGLILRNPEEISKPQKGSIEIKLGIWLNCLIHTIDDEEEDSNPIPQTQNVLSLQR